jgi:hypothetical protein
MNKFVDELIYKKGTYHEPNSTLCALKKNCFFADQLAEGVIENLMQNPPDMLKLHLKFVLIILTDPNSGFSLRKKLISRL